jgi:hypothetical protein
MAEPMNAAATLIPDRGWSRGPLAWLAALALAASGAAVAQQEPAAGSFIVVTGEVKVLGADGSVRAAQRGGALRQGEAIVTGADGLAQLRMTDGSALSLRAGSQLKLDRYRFAGADDPEPGFFASLVKGGFRTITGLIGRKKRDNYRVGTPSATLGIRGTHFEIVHVERQLPDAAPGTYNRVYEGITTFRNRAGVELLVSREQTAFVALPGNLAPALVVPPAGIFGRPTPVPTLKPQADSGPEDKVEAGRSLAPRAKERAPAVAAPKTGAATAPAAAPLLNPIDTPATISPILTAPTTTVLPTLTAPVTTTISPTSTEPASTTISPTLTAPLTTTITAPTLTAPATTTISPTLTAPLTTTITAPTTTISPTLTAPLTTTITAPTTTISPTLTAPLTNTIKR